MAGNIDLQDVASGMVQRALDSGEWRLVRDATGRQCYFNELTRETTRDLRVLLLKRHDWSKAGGAGQLYRTQAPTSATDATAAGASETGAASTAAASMPSAELAAA